jgi:hypothetical protein
MVDTISKIFSRCCFELRTWTTVSSHRSLASLGQFFTCSVSNSLNIRKLKLVFLSFILGTKIPIIADILNIKHIALITINADFIFFAQRRAHAPLGAGTEVSHGVGVVITVNHVNRTAPSGCVARLVGLLYSVDVTLLARNHHS